MQNKDKHPIALLRKKHGLSQEAMGALIGAARRTVQDWELGNRNCPPAKLKLAKLLLGEK